MRLLRDGRARVVIAIAVGLGLIAGMLVVVLSDREQRLAGSNSFVKVSGVALKLRPHGRRCQTETVPPGAAGLRVFADATKSPLRVVVLGAKRNEAPLAEATLRPTGSAGPVAAELLPRVGRESRGARICIRNLGSESARLAGNRTAVLGGPGNPGAVVADDDVRIDYLRRGHESWWDIASVVADRFGLVKTSFFGSWMLAALLALVGLTWAAAVVLLLRTQR